MELSLIRERLNAERAELVQDTEAQREERGAEVLDASRVGRLSRMDAMQVRAMAGATAQRRQARLAQVEAALARIAAGEYGTCVACDEPIAPKRLELDPSATLCIVCAEAEA